MCSVKVVYNTCYGGFGLSKKAAIRLLELGVEDESLREQLSNDNVSIFESYYLDSVERHDRRLVQVVEELGEEANGAFADLTIKELIGDRYKINEYDGFETVIEPNDVKWIVVNDHEKN